MVNSMYVNYILTFEVHKLQKKNRSRNDPSTKPRGIVFANKQCKDVRHSARHSWAPDDCLRNEQTSPVPTVGRELTAQPALSTAPRGRHRYVTCQRGTGSRDKGLAAGQWWSQYWNPVLLEAKV